MSYQKPVMLPTSTKEYLDEKLNEINSLRIDKGIKQLTRGDLILHAIKLYNINRGLKI